MAEMIKFLRGNVASLPATATAGAVYFTKDEGLYLGLEDGSYHRYGDFITVADVTSLPTDGAHETCMYYCVSENVLAKWNETEGRWVQINKQKTLAELGGVAKSVYEAKVTALEKADTDNATAISNLTTYVGTIPDGYTEQTIVAYINKKAEETLSAASGGSTESAASVLAALNTYKAENDSRVAANTTAAANAQTAADTAQADVDALELKVGTVDEGKTVVGLIGEVQTQADKGVTDAATAQARADAAYDLANGKATMDQVNEAITGAGHAVKSEVDQAISDLDTAYKAADSTLETKLQGNIDKKVDQTAYDTKITELAGMHTTLQGNIDTEAQTRKDADDAQVARIAALEGTITGLSGAMHFKGVKTEIPTDVTGYVDGDVIIIGEKEYVFNNGEFVEFGDISAEGDRIAALETIVGKAAEGEAAATGLVKDVADNTAAIAAEKARAEAKEAELVQADATNLQTAKDYADDAVEALGIGDYIKKVDADVAYATVGHNHDDKYDAKGDAAQALVDAKAYADGLADNYAAADHDHVVADITDFESSVATKVESYGYATTGYADGKASAAQSAAEAKAAELDASLKTTLQAEIDADVKVVNDAFEAYKTSNNTEVAKKANSADVYTKAEVEAMLTWGEFGA